MNDRTAHQPSPGAPDTRTIALADDVLRDERRLGLGRLLPFLGPAFIASVAYMDPGNFATNIEGGARFGYLLLWVVVASNAVAMLLQLLAAKLGVATGRNLAELCREQLPAWLTWPLWILMEVVAMATDLAEFVGAALGFQLLLGMPLWAGGIATGVATVLLLALQRYGFRRIEAVITTFVGVVAVCYLVEIVLGQPDWGAIAYHAVVPRFDGAASVLLAAGILGATVMPHVIFLHSSLTQGRIPVREPELRRRLFRYQILDIMIALGIAGAVNAAMMVMAASTFHRSGVAVPDSIAAAYRTLAPLLGGFSAFVFGLSLLAAGLSSSVVGTMSGQVVMQGFVRFRIPLWVRRAVTMLPSMVVILAGLNVTRTLVISQVVLSFALPFAIVPLVVFTARRSLMAELVNHPLTTAAASVIGALVVALNLFLLYRLVTGA